MEYDCSLVNGTDCTPSAGLSKFRFQSGKRHRLRLINGGAEGLQKFAIDNHTMTIIANDFVPVKPYNAQVVTLGVGQRTDIIVEGTGDSAGAFWMRSTVSSQCSHTNQGFALAAIYYENANTTSTPQSVATLWNDTSCANDDLELTEPLYEMTPPPAPAFTQQINVNFSTNATGAEVWMMNNESFRANYECVEFAPSLYFNGLRY
jgi:FtsP/CotA-like multicopper oxidase with cupredoxin domain